MPSKNEITITATMSRQEAWAFAEFLKRQVFSDYLNNTVNQNEDEAYQMIYGANAIVNGLANAGIAPR